MRDEMKKSAVAIAVTSLIAVAYILRTNPLFPYTGGDNAWYILLAKSLAEGHGYRDLFYLGAPANTHFPPLFPLMISIAIAIAGYNLYAIKMVVSIFAVASFILSYLFFKRAKFPFPLVPALCFVVSYKFFSISDDVLSEPMFMTFVFGALYSARNYIEAKTKVWLFATIALCWAAIITRTAGIVLAPAFAAVIIFRSQDRKKAIMPAGAIMAIIFIPLLIWTLRNRLLGDAAESYGSQFLAADPYDPTKGMIGISSLTNRIYAAVAYYLADATTYFIPADFTSKAPREYFIGALFWAIALYGLFRRWRAEKSPSEIFVALYLVMITTWPFIEPRFMLPIYPLLFAYICVAFADLNERFLSGNARREMAINVVAAFGLCTILIANVAADVGYSRFTSNARKEAYVTKEGLEIHPTSLLMDEIAQSSLWIVMNGRKDCTIVARKPSLVALVGAQPIIAAPFPFPDDPWKWAEEKNVCYVMVNKTSERFVDFANLLINSSPKPDSTKIAFSLGTTLVLEIKR